MVSLKFSNVKTWKNLAKKHEFKVSQFWFITNCVSLWFEYASRYLDLRTSSTMFVEVKASNTYVWQSEDDTDWLTEAFFNVK